MIFGHAPIIVPAVAGLAIPYRPRFAPCAAARLAHLRIGADSASWLPGRQWGGMLNAVAVVLFFLNMASAALTPRPA